MIGGLYKVSHVSAAREGTKLVKKCVHETKHQGRYSQHFTFFVTYKWDQ